MAVRAFDPAPKSKSGKPAAPASFSVTPSGKAGMETGGPQAYQTSTSAVPAIRTGRNGD